MSREPPVNSYPPLEIVKITKTHRHILFTCIYQTIIGINYSLTLKLKIASIKSVNGTYILRLLMPFQIPHLWNASWLRWRAEETGQGFPWTWPRRPHARLTPFLSFQWQELSLKVRECASVCITAAFSFQYLTSLAPLQGKISVNDAPF